MKITKKLIPFLFVIFPLLNYYLLVLIFGGYFEYGPDEGAGELLSIVFSCGLYFIELAIIILVYIIKVIALTIKKSRNKWYNIIVACKYLLIMIATGMVARYVMESCSTAEEAKCTLYIFILTLLVVEILFIIGESFYKKAMTNEEKE